MQTIIFLELALSLNSYVDKKFKKESSTLDITNEALLREADKKGVQANQE